MKYSELVQMWQKNREDWHEYDDEVITAVSRIYKRVKDILEVPDHLIKLINPDDNDEKISKTKYTPRGSIVRCDDGWTKFGIILTIEIEPDTYPKSNYQFEMRLKRKEHSWLFKITEDSSQIELKYDIQEEDGQHIVDAISNLMERSLKDGVKKWLSQGEEN